MSTKSVWSGAGMLVGAAVLGQLALGSSQANATAFAYSALDVTNFALNTSVFGGFQTFQFTSQPVSTSLNGTTVNSPSIISASGSGASTNQAQIALGSTAFAADNQYFGANRPTFGNPNADFAVSDSHQTDTRISTGFGSGHFGTQSGAQGTGDAGTGAADTGADNSLSWNFNVSTAELAAAGGNMVLNWSFDALYTLFAKTQNDGETARATLEMTVLLVKSGGATQTAEIFDENANLQFPGEAGDPNEISEKITDTFLITTAGNYSFQIVYDSSAQVSSVPLPEPGTLGLLGLGLIGLGASAYRRKIAA